jgi:hypothetical protein
MCVRVLLWRQQRKEIDAGGDDDFASFVGALELSVTEKRPMLFFLRVPFTSEP